ncbi:MAG TPA: response regulator [Bacteroidales bacterium]|nr:response regulator [Bacteroidales bacterium]
MPVRNILVIDDSNTNIVLLEVLLEKNGYRVFSALSAMEGIDSMKENLPDLIYLDLLMPEVDGLEFIRIVKNNQHWKNIPVVILSAITDSDIIKKSLELGVTEYITKPLNIHRIVSLAKDILNN